MHWKVPWRALERFLLMDRLDSGWAILRTRATYSILLCFVLVQTTNIFISLYTFGGWTVYHWPSVAFSIFCLGAVVILRWFKASLLFATVLGATMIAGIVIPASLDNTGIDTSLLPYLAISPLVLTFVGGWRVGLVFLPIALVVLVLLAENATPGNPGFLTGLSMMQELRLTQGVFAICLATFAATALSAAAEEALDSLESARSRALEAERAKSQFLASMSHELRTPMNAVLGLTGVLLETHDDPLSERQRKLMTTVDNAGSHLLSIVDDILNLSKLEADKVAVEKAPLNLTALLETVLETFSANAETSGLALTLDVGEELPELLLGDELRIRQIFSNLVSNAIKFTQEGGVAIRAGALPGRKGWAWIEVQDTGHGIPAERLEAVFDPFEQAENGTLRRHDGTGLGLPICRKLTELMGGEISIKRTGPSGTTFVVILPLPEAKAHKPKKSAQQADRSVRLDGLSILVAEDNPVNQLVTEEILKLLGATSRFAENGREVLELMGTVDVDLILMDKHMPIMDGIEATRAIRESGEPWADVPIIAATADAMEGEEAALLDVGMDGFIAKPMRADRLAETVDRVLKSRLEVSDDEALIA